MLLSVYHIQCNIIHISMTLPLVAHVFVHCEFVNILHFSTYVEFKRHKKRARKIMKTNYDEWKEFFTFVYFNHEAVFIVLHSKYYAKVEVWYVVPFLSNDGMSMKFKWKLKFNLFVWITKRANILHITILIIFECIRKRELNKCEYVVIISTILCYSSTQTWL